TVTVTQPIEGIDLPESIELAVGGEDSATLTPTLTPENAQGVITWTSSDEAVATVDAKGVVSAVCKGSCTIRAEAGGVSAETDVTVTVAPTGITLAQSSGILTVGGSTALTVYTVPEEAEAADPAQLTYTSSNESVAAVSEDGTVTAKGAGSAVITVTYQGSMTAEYSLTVRAKQTARPGTSTGSTAGTGGTGSAGATAPSGGGTAPAPSPTPDPAPTEPQHYHGNGSDAGVCPVCGVHYSPDVALDPDAPVHDVTLD
ncbi:Ig domain-containing protein, partial [Ruthenibacterium lactatiformans]|uniref:Ig-like domain-containing protein n=1 Tax=Ruthenibacterium lactatiformans TaxID=1550024 RepID=UPI0019679601